MKLKRVLLCLLFTCVGVQCLLDKPEGSYCEVNGRNGTCVIWYRCFSIMVDHHDQLPYPPLCSFKGQDPIVCCTSCRQVTDIREIVYNNIVGVPLFKEKQKSWNKCMEYFLNLPYECTEGIVGGMDKDYNEDLKCDEVGFWSASPAGGEDAERGEFPHMALLGFGSSEADAEYSCGGTIISERFVLTAGHCIATPRLGNVTYIAAGILRRSDPPELWQRYRVADIIPHPQYDPPSKYHDIALLKTDKTIVFSELVLPACLPRLQRHPEDLDSDELEDDEAVAVGWGRTYYKGEPANTLQRVNLTKFSKSNCARQYGKRRYLERGYDHETQMCYGDATIVRDTCEGDSGGPLQVEGILMYCQPVVVGVTSFGDPCGFVNNAGIYTRVEYYVPWIDSIVF